MPNLLQTLKNLPEIDYGENPDLHLYRPLTLSEKDLPELLEIAKTSSPFYQGPEEEFDLALFHAVKHARCIIARFANPAHFSHFYEMLLKAEEIDDDNFYLSFPWFIKQLGPTVIDEILAAFSQDKQTTNTKQTLAEALFQFSELDDYRARIVETLRHGFETNELSDLLNLQLIDTLIAFRGVEAIEQITAIDNEGLLDHHLTGDLEEIQIALGLATVRQTLIPSDEPNNSVQSLTHRKEQLGPIPQNASSEEIVDYTLSLYQSSGSIADHAELQGCFAATILTSPILQYHHYLTECLMWSGHHSGRKTAPWLSEDELNHFHDHAQSLYTAVSQAISAQSYSPSKNLTSWARGFLLGIKHQPSPIPALSTPLEKLITSVKAAETTTSFEERQTIATLLQDYTEAYHEYKEEERLRKEQVGKPIHREGPKINRNDPCPCGSGKKFKKCCA